MLSGHEHDPLYSISIRNKVFHCISRENGDHYYIQARHSDLFSHYNLILSSK